jgi:hypothetical protein
VGFLQQLVVGDGLPVGFGRLGVASLGEEEPPQEQQRLLVLPRELLLALRRPFALRRVLQEVAPVKIDDLLQVPDGLLG